MNLLGVLTNTLAVLAGGGVEPTVPARSAGKSDAWRDDRNRLVHLVYRHFR